MTRLVVRPEPGDPSRCSCRGPLGLVELSDGEEEFIPYVVARDADEDGDVGFCLECAVRRGWTGAGDVREAGQAGLSAAEGAGDGYERAAGVLAGAETQWATVVRRLADGEEWYLEWGDEAAARAELETWLAPGHRRQLVNRACGPWEVVATRGSV